MAPHDATHGLPRDDLFSFLPGGGAAGSGLLGPRRSKSFWPDFFLIVFFAGGGGGREVPPKRRRKELSSRKPHGVLASILCVFWRGECVGRWVARYEPWGVMNAAVWHDEPSACPKGGGPLWHHRLLGVSWICTTWTLNIRN